MRLEKPKYSIEQVSTKCGKLLCTSLPPQADEAAVEVAEAFAKDEIGVGHALMPAKL